MKREEEKQSKRQKMESSSWEVVKKAQGEEGSSQMKETKGQHEAQEEHQEQVIMDSRWRAFPPKLHQTVLRFIPIPDLCRFRTVSRDWNNISKQLSFTLQSRPQEATFVFRTMDSLYVELAQETIAISQRRWQIYDPITEKSFKLNMEFLYEGVRDRFDVHDHCETLAADKGFVAVMWNSGSPTPRKVVQIANPVTRSVVEISPLPQGLSVNTRFGTFNMFGIDCERAVSLVMAEDYTEFALYYVLGGKEEDPERKRAFRFHSNVGEWREIPHPPKEDHEPEDILNLDSTLFTVLWDIESEKDLRPKLFAFDTKRDEWSDTGLLLPRDVLIVRLATTKGRLFIFAYGRLHGVEGLEGKLGVMLVEIDVALCKCTLVATLNRMQDFNAFFKEMNLIVRSEHVVTVVGCGDYIVISCTNDIAVAYDLALSIWCEWTEDRMITSLDDGDNFSNVACCDAGYGKFATVMNLSLNPVPAILQ